MKKIKITQEQAKMLKEMSKKPQRVLKITQEQYDKIVQSERAMIDEKQNISTSKQMKKNFEAELSRPTKKFMKTIKCFLIFL